MAHYKGAAKEASRAMNLMKKRQKEQEELEIRKKKIEEELKISAISSKFAVHYDAVETKLKSDTIGLVTLDEMRARQEDVVKERERQIAVTKGEAHLKSDSGKLTRLRQMSLKQKTVLSFDPDEDEDDAAAAADDDDDDDMVGSDRNGKMKAEMIETVVQQEPTEEEKKRHLDLDVMDSDGKKKKVPTATLR